MAGEAVPPKEFPDVTQKLSAPKKLSAFEKERQAADEKRRRAEAEDAAALKAFQDSFADEDEDPLARAIRARDRGPPSGPRGGGYGGGMPPMRGRGGGGDMGPPSLKRKRALDEMREAQEARREQQYNQATLGYEDSRRAARAQQDEEREDEAPRPTVQLSHLPPDMTKEAVEVLLQPYIQVHSVNFSTPNGPGLGKRSLTAIASLTMETSTSQIDTAVSALKDKYLGCGFYLSISRHLSSTALHPSMTAPTSSISTEPFGAEKPRDPPRGSTRNAPPPPMHDRRGFAPPDSYDYPPRGRDERYGMPPRPEAVINVQAPPDVATLRAIHTLVERLITEPTPLRAMKMEALLMATPSVQRDERFAFLYDSRRPAGVYYRYLLWGPGEPTSDRKRKAKGLERVHDDTVLEWSPPDWQKEVPFLDLTDLRDVVEDVDYVSSDEESEDEERRTFHDNRDAAAGAGVEKKEHLNPLKRARLVHLLSRLPTNHARLRKGDLARVTNFAITHAGAGAEEIVDLLLLNIEKPFPLSLAAKYEDDSDEAEKAEEDEEDDYEPEDVLPSFAGVPPPPPPPKDDKREQEDISGAKLVALYAVSDILSASSTAGARNAWKYRQLFETGFKAQKTFEKLGRLDRSLAWGRLKAEQWKRRVGAIFAVWEGWSVFSSDVQEDIRQSFLEPPLTEEEREAERAREEEAKQQLKVKAIFKRIGAIGSASPAPSPADNVDGQAMDDVNGAPMPEDDIDGAPMDEDVDGAPMAMDEDVDGAPMEDDVDGTPLETLAAKQNGDGGLTDSMPVAASETPKPPGPKRRMRAEDMFASDEE